MGGVPAKGSLNASYRLHADGLDGTAIVREDLATGAFVESDRSGLESAERGFDGAPTVRRGGRHDGDPLHMRGGSRRG